ncbi:MAG: aminodeoxychorismate synthase component I [Sphingomonadales bacterium]
MKFPPKPPFVLLEDSQATSKKKAGLLFTNPVEIIQCNTLSKVKKTLLKIEKSQKKGFFLAGWVSFEAGTAFHPALKRTKHKTSTEPLVWMGVFKKPQNLSSQQLSSLFNSVPQISPRAGLVSPPKNKESRAKFNQVFKRILAYIKAGDVYQVNHTFRLNLKTFGPFFSLYAALRKAQPAPYSALINTGDWRILSFSPELFISKQGQTLISRPMKGTAKPGVNELENKKRMKALREDKKNRAENLMITDLIRNDFSRITEPGSVKVLKLFEVERFKNILQMSSEVTGTLKKGSSFFEIFSALFPCGSITGAPKIRAMEIIKETEADPRGLYTGALGFLTPGGNFTFSVPIRTAVLNPQGEGWFGIGSGLVSGSKVRDEFEECQLKGNFLKNIEKDFALIETMLWTEDTGVHFYDAHMKRLASSANYFGFQIKIKQIKNRLSKISSTFIDKNPKKIRLTLARSGELNFETQNYNRPKNKDHFEVIISPHKVSSMDPFLFHKTTNRALFNSELEHSKNQKFYDILFVNEKGNITEGAFNNIFVQGNRGELFTPSLKCGLLPGILRAKLVESGKFKETSLTCDELEKATKIWLGNSVTGLVEVNLRKSSKTR